MNPIHVRIPWPVSFSLAHIGRFFKFEESTLKYFFAEPIQGKLHACQVGFEVAKDGRIEEIRLIQVKPEGSSLGFLESRARELQLPLFRVLSQPDLAQLGLRLLKLVLASIPPQQCDFVAVQYSPEDVTPLGVVPSIEGQLFAGGLFQIKGGWLSAIQLRAPVLVTASTSPGLVLLHDWSADRYMILPGAGWKLSNRGTGEITIIFRTKRIPTSVVT